MMEILQPTTDTARRAGHPLREFAGRQHTNRQVNRDR